MMWLEGNIIANISLELSTFFLDYKWLNFTASLYDCPLIVDRPIRSPPSLATLIRCISGPEVMTAVIATAKLKRTIIHSLGKR